MNEIRSQPCGVDRRAVYCQAPARVILLVEAPVQQQTIQAVCLGYQFQ
jgi:hypothetical protein